MLQLFLEDGHVKVEVSAKQTPGKVRLDNFQTAHNDGRWHYVSKDRQTQTLCNVFEKL